MWRSHVQKVKKIDSIFLNVKIRQELHNLPDNKCPRVFKKVVKFSCRVINLKLNFIRKPYKDTIFFGWIEVCKISKFGRKKSSRILKFAKIPKEKIKSDFEVCKNSEGKNQVAFCIELKVTKNRTFWLVAPKLAKSAPNSITNYWCTKYYANLKLLKLSEWSHYDKKIKSVYLNKAFSENIKWNYFKFSKLNIFLRVHS